MKKFAIIGTAGFVAPRHLRAIKDTGNVLVAALDKHDSVGILDSYSIEAAFFTEFERFDRHLEMLKHSGQGVDFVSVCSPNYLHDAHVRFGLRIGADVICEKPLVLNPWNVDALCKAEEETGKRIFNILQVRLHPAIIELKRKVDAGPADKIYDIDLTYITTRGRWYMSSWKGDVSKSGGIATNIGVHFFDMLTWIFGEAQENIVHICDDKRAAGYLRLKRANVRWLLSLHESDLPREVEAGESVTYRTISIDGEDIEFSSGFKQLHTETYRQILANKGFGPKDVMPAIKIVSDIRESTPVGLIGDYHPMAKKNHQ